MTVPYLLLYAALRWKCLFSPQMYGLFLGIRFSYMANPKIKPIGPIMPALTNMVNVGIIWNRRWLESIKKSCSQSARRFWL